MAGWRLVLYVAICTNNPTPLRRGSAHHMSPWPVCIGTLRLFPFHCDFEQTSGPDTVVRPTVALTLRCRTAPLIAWLAQNTALISSNLHALSPFFAVEVSSSLPLGL